MTPTPKILCAGSALWDIIARTEREMKPGHDVPGRITRQLGGVALNVALALAARGRRPGLLSVVGTDAAGDRLVAAAEGAGIQCTDLYRTADPTDTYLAIEDGHGDVFAAIADCASLERAGAQALAPLKDGRIASADAPFAGYLVVDGNFPQEILDTLHRDAAFDAARLALVPASPGKATRLARVMAHPGATLYVNRIEAEILCGAEFTTADDAAQALLDQGAADVVVTDSARTAAAAGPGGAVSCAPPKITARTSTGAGDAFLAAHLDARERGATPQDALATAVTAAAAHVSGGEFEHG